MAASGYARHVESLFFACDRAPSRQISLSSSCSASDRSSRKGDRKRETCKDALTKPSFYFSADVARKRPRPSFSLSLSLSKKKKKKKTGSPAKVMRTKPAQAATPRTEEEQQEASAPSLLEP